MKQISTAFIATILTLFTLPAEAEISLALEQVYIRTVTLERMSSEGSSDTNDFELTSETFESWSQYSVSSKQVPQKLMSRPEQSVESEALLAPTEIWQIEFAEGLPQVRGVRGANGELVSPLVYLNELRQERTGAVVTEFFDFVSTELPEMNLKNESPQVSLESDGIECRFATGSENLVCIQRFLSKVTLSSHRYEYFRDLGIEPLLILRKKSLKI